MELNCEKRLFENVLYFIGFKPKITIEKRFALWVTCNILKEINTSVITFWSFFNPSINWFDTGNVADYILQMWAIANQIETKRKFKEIQMSYEKDVRPCQLKITKFLMTV